MGQCVICGKQTENEYHYHPVGADNRTDKRENLPVFACTKCLLRRGTIVLWVITVILFFPMVSNFAFFMSRMGSGSMDAVGFVISLIFFGAMLAWTLSRVRRMKADRPISKAAATRKLTRRAKFQDLSTLRPDGTAVTKKPVRERGQSMAWKVIGLFISIGLILGGLSGEMVLRGTESSGALVVFGVIFLIYDIWTIATHKSGKNTAEETEPEPGSGSEPGQNE